MRPNSGVVRGTVMIEGIPFEWEVADGLTQQLTVSHPDGNDALGEES